jgi:soluble lytic murein transglycosylase-like protein
MVNMTQRLIIHLIPIEVLLIAALASGVLIASRGARLFIEAAPPAAPAPAQAQAVVPISPIFTPEVRYWAEKIAGWAAAHQLDPNLVATVMQIESCGSPQAVSSSGAQGLFQVMPFHFAAEDHMQDPDTNASRGLAYLALGLARAGGNAGLALAGYNGGHSVIGRDSSMWSAETRRYWYWGVGIYQDALSGQTQSARLQEWLQAGGASLCARAAQELGVTN